MTLRNPKKIGDDTFLKKGDTKMTDDDLKRGDSPLTQLCNLLLLFYDIGLAQDFFSFDIEHENVVLKVLKDCVIF